ncbi:MAG: NAD-glutamate dehydrogenase domain-containing protein, partial [Campylobacterales bacterium]
MDLCAQLISPMDTQLPQFKGEIFVTRQHHYLYIYSKKQIPISKIANLMESFGIGVSDLISFQLEGVYVYKFLPLREIGEEVAKRLFQIIQQALEGRLPERCQLYQFLTLGLTLREMWLLHGLLKYESQLILEYSENFISSVAIEYSPIVLKILDYFFEKFNPDRSPRKLQELEEEIQQDLKEVKGLTEDRVIQLLFWIVKSIVRTNYYLEKESISFKVEVSNLWRFLNGIQPLWEGFVYHPRFYGLHLRMSKISRGGLRWSNRYEDLREEIKSLMITQEAKNAIIVPEGAKGGFVIFEKNLSKEEFKGFYSQFIDALLDLIDIGENPRIVKYDREDFYFVVAADKGTADMSDVANEIAIKRGYLLKDAFASGGSKGYNHKELGVTAKGAIRSAARHFLEIGKDIYRDPISVVGVGSMRGDVFGNGMLINPNFRLLAAISHREIFIDPAPDPAVAYRERLRLFKEGLGWSSYDRTKISKGGGVFDRTQKSIPLSPEIRKMLKTEKEVMSGEELVRELLKMEVELLYFGGIGTYIKSSDETNQDVGDKENEGVRVNGDEVKAFAICEGANLALTQKGRIEYAKRGGRLNLDAIDNSAGVNTSDYEVNLKILLNQLTEKGVISEIEKDEILFSLTDWVLERVLENNYYQSLIISIDQRRVKKRDFIEILNILEENIKFFKRKHFAIPKNEGIEGVIKDEQVVRPILGILLLYSKILVKKYLLLESFIDSQLARRFYNSYFPANLRNFDHPLRREITATAIANYIINRTGIRFLRNFNPQLLEKQVQCYLVLDELIGAEEIRREILNQDLKMPVEVQYTLLAQIEESLYFGTQWMVRHYRKFKNIDIYRIVKYRGEVKEFISRR